MSHFFTLCNASVTAIGLIGGVTAKVYTELVELSYTTDLKADCLSQVQPFGFDVRS